MEQGDQKILKDEDLVLDGEPVKPERKRVTEEEQKEYNKKKELSTQQKIEVHLSSIARNMNLITLALFGMCCGILCYLLSDITIAKDAWFPEIKEIIIILILAFFSIFFYLVNALLPRGSLSRKIWVAITATKIGEQIKYSLTGTGENQGDQ
jgi:hypothetical protein